MIDKPAIFEISTQQNIDAFLHKLNKGYRFEFENHETDTCALFDTFDWRFFQTGYWVLVRRKTMELHRLADFSLVETVDFKKLPCFIWDIPESGFKARATSVLEMRALQKLLTIRSTAEKFIILNDDKKTVARFQIIAFDGDKTGSRMIRNIELMRVRGYEDDFRAIAKLLEQVGAERKSHSAFESVLVAAGLSPGGYTAKLNFQLTPEMPAGEAARIILRHLLNIMRLNVPGIKADIDTEYLHDFRVAIRRTRSALAQIKDVFPAEATREFRNKFAEIGRMTNQLRDLDVYLLDADAYRALLPDALKPGIEPFFDYLLIERKKALAKIRRWLNSKKYQQVLSEWEAFLQTADAASMGSNAHLPVIDLANTRIYKKYRAVLKDGKKITPETVDDDLHALRIDCKKLRYLMEFFASLYPADDIGALIKQLKKLQDNLGRFNDYCVQAETLLHLIDRFHEEKTGTYQTIAALGGLVGAILMEKQFVRSEFQVTFSKFAGKQNKRHFLRLFNE